MSNISKTKYKYFKKQIGDLFSQVSMAPQVGLEPTTPRLTAACSTD